MKSPKISIITPSYNQGAYIEKTIQSVLEQDYPHLEYIIIDGGSTDQTLEIINKYKENLDYWVSEPDQGQSHAINKGLKVATGDIVNWLNSDDYYEPGVLQRVADIFTKTSANVVCGRSRVFSTTGTLYFSEGTDIYPNNLPKTLGWARIDQPETFFARSVFDEIGPLDPQFKYIMDRDLWVKYLLKFGLEGIRKVDETWVNFRHHPNSKTVSQAESFSKERDNLFYSLACQSEHFYEAAVIETVSPVDENFQFHYSDLHPHTELIKAALQYYLFLKGKEFYTWDDKPRAGVCFEALDPSLLSKHDRYKLKSFYLRNRYIPLGVLDLFRKTRKKLSRETG